MEREKFKINAKKKIDEIFNKINELEYKKDKVKADLKTDYNNKIEQFKEKKKDLEKKYNALEEASDEKWTEVKEAFSESAESFKQGFNDLGKIFK